MAEVLNWPRAVRIEFTRPAKWFSPVSWAIRAVEGTDYSHVRLRWFSVSGEELIYEASGTQVHTIGRYAQTPTVVVKAHTFYLTKEQYKDLIGLFRFSGVKYGTWQILGILLSRMFGFKKNILSSGKDRMVCSELVGYFLIDVMGFSIPIAEFDLIGPKGIHDLLSYSS